MSYAPGRPPAEAVVLEAFRLLIPGGLFISISEELEAVNYVYIYIYIYVCIYTHVLYIYIYTERERERERLTTALIVLYTQIFT